MLELFEEPRSKRVERQIDVDRYAIHLCFSRTFDGLPTVPIGVFGHRTTLRLSASLIGERGSSCVVDW